MKEELKMELNTRAEIIDILNTYSKYLEKRGYMDSDWWCEEPNTVEDFIKCIVNDKTITTDDKLNNLINICECSVSIEVDNHKDVFQTAEEYLNDARNYDDDIDDIDDDIYNEMLRLNTVVEVQAYPNTPSGFYKVYHYNIDKALQMIIDAISHQ